MKKTMKKLIGFLLALAISSSCLMLVGCEWKEFWGQTTTTPEPPYEDEEIPDEELISNMKWDYLRTFDIKDASHSGVLVEYCSNQLYNGYVVAMLDGCRHKPEGAIETIGGVDFKYFDTNRLYAYKDGSFLTLEEAYSQGILTAEDLQEISDEYSYGKTYYYQICDFYDCYQGSLSFYKDDIDEKRDRVFVVLHPGDGVPPLSFFELDDKYSSWMEPKVVDVIDLNDQLWYSHIHSETGHTFAELVFDKEYTGHQLSVYAAYLLLKPGFVSIGFSIGAYPGFETVTEITDADLWALDYITDKDKVPVTQ